MFVHRRERKSSTFSKTNPTFSRGFSLTTAIQILSVERRLLTITLMYGIITAEKEFLRSRIFDFLIASISHRNGIDHTFDHLRLRTTWKLWVLQHVKARFSDEKARKSTQNEAKNRCFCVWEQDVAGSNTIKSSKIGTNLICHRRLRTIVP